MRSLNSFLFYFIVTITMSFKSLTMKFFIDVPSTFGTTITLFVITFIKITLSFTIHLLYRVTYIYIDQDFVIWSLHSIT